MLNNIRKQIKEELIVNAKMKFMEEYFEMSQSIKNFTNKKGEEYEAVTKRIEELENNMKCLETLKVLINNEMI